MSKEQKKKGDMYEMYGNFVRVPYQWYKLCRKYIIPKELKEFKGKATNCIELNPMEINVFAYLANYDECFVSNNSIAEVFNVKKKTIEKYMKELRWVGFIKTFESKDNPTYTDRRDIYVQHDAIKKVLEFEGDIYNVPYECGVSDDEVPYKRNLSTLQTEGNYPTDVTEVPYTCKTNKKELEYIKINKNNDDEDKSSSLGSDEPQQKTETTYSDRYTLVHQSPQTDLNIYKDITEQDIRELQFNSKTHYDMYDDYEYTERIYQQYVQCCDRKRNAYDTISAIKLFMKQFNCDEKAIETCVGYFLYQHRMLKRNIEDIQICFNVELAS